MLILIVDYNPSDVQYKNIYHVGKIFCFLLKKITRNQLLLFFNSLVTTQ